MATVKIVVVGGGSAHWIPTIATDLALTPGLEGSHLTLYDIDSKALGLTLPLAQRIVEEAGTSWRVTATTDRSTALNKAHYVLLAIRVGGVEAMKADLEIPLRYGIRQSVGDTVGPGGVSRALRHIPVAVDLAKEMERLCPDAWLINLTNPMATICRAVTKVTNIRTVGLCHEVTDSLERLATCLGTNKDDIQVQIAGINHFPWVVRLRIDGRDGFTLLREYLEQHSPFEFVADMDENDFHSSFEDRLAVKFLLFQRYGTFPAAGDRHVSEFLPWVLTKASNWGRRYGVLLTTPEFRIQEWEYYHKRAQQMLSQRAPLSLAPSGEEQLADVIAALVGVKSDRFIVDVPNRGQIANLPMDAVVEVSADVSAQNVEPICVSPLPRAVHQIVLGHVLRQEMIVDAALHGDRHLALEALSNDPLISDWEHTPQMLDELLYANRDYLPQFSL